ncbi:hypothetical protein CANCADRAFT_13294, partial [Tortispora caseinolytica NRRL Y-17796]
ASAVIKVTVEELNLSEKEISKVWRKVDSRVLALACLLYLASYIDRANIGNAKVLGMSADLNLSANYYYLALSIFFVGYVVFETPSNIILKFVGPRYYIPTLTIVWGGICALVGTVQSGAGLVAIRFFLGLAEAGLLPGITYLMATWYPRGKLGRRYAVLYSTVSLTGAFGGLLATAIHSLNGRHGIAGWRWIFIVEGVVTVGIGLFALIVMYPYPENAKFLTERERQYLLAIHAKDRAQHKAQGLNWAYAKTAFKDYRTYLWGLIYFATYIPVYSVILSLPSVITGLGFEGTTATLMACPPYGLGFIVVLISGYTSDKHRDRFWHAVIPCFVASAALIVLIAVTSNWVRYAMFFFVMFMFVPICTNWSWQANNTAGTNKRAVATGLIYSMGNIGGAIAGQIYRAEWAPYYRPGHGINIACFGVAVIAMIVIRWTYIRDNRLRDELLARDNENSQETFTEQDQLELDLGLLGDRHPRFRY